MSFLFLLIVVGVIVYVVTKNSAKAAPGSAAAVAPGMRPASPPPKFVDFDEKKAELIKLFDRLGKVIEDALHKPGKPGQSFTLTPLREEIDSLLARARRATTEDQLAMLFIEARRVFDQVNQVVELPKEFFLRDARQAAHDGIGADMARDRMATGSMQPASGMSFWDWYIPYQLLFSDHSGHHRDDYLRNTVGQVYNQKPDWIDTTGGEAIGDPMKQLDSTLQDWRSAPLDSTLQQDWQRASQDLTSSVDKFADAEARGAAGGDAASMTTY